jgi:protoporphyrinogen oxidase
MKLTDYDVVLWLKSPSSAPNLFARIVGNSKKEPYETSEYEGLLDIHWGFSNSRDAIEFAEGLLEFAALDDVKKLTVIGANDASIGRKVYKDTMASLRT